jgi:hypothetical protein
MRRALIVIFFLLGCHSPRDRAIAPPATGPIEPIGVTVTKGDFIVVGKQDKGIAVYLTIDRRERTCLIEAQNAIDKPVAILDSFTDTALYRGFGFCSSANLASTQPATPFRAAMIQIYPAQVLRGSLSFPDSPEKQQLRFRLYYDDPNLTKWIDLETPEFEVSR